MGLIKEIQIYKLTKGSDEDRQKALQMFEEMQNDSINEQNQLLGAIRNATTWVTPIVWLAILIILLMNNNAMNWVGPQFAPYVIVIPVLALLFTLVWYLIKMAWKHKESKQLQIYELPVVEDEKPTKKKHKKSSIEDQLDEIDKL